MNVRRIIPHLLFVGLGVWAMTSRAEAQASWQRSDSSLDGQRIFSLCAWSDRNDQLLAASSDGLFVGGQEGHFRPLSSFISPGTRIQDLWCDSERGEILVATTKGLYQLSGTDQRARKIYDSSDEQERDCRAVLASLGDVYLGTVRGVFVRKKGQPLWQKISAGSTRRIDQLMSSGTHLYILAGVEVITFDMYAMKDLKTYRDGYDISDSDDGRINRLRTLHATRDGQVILATHGQFLLSERNRSWQPLKQAQAPFREVRSMLELPGPPTSGLHFDNYLVASDRGVFAYIDDGWVQLNAGLESPDARDLAWIPDGMVWLATNGGIYRMPLTSLLVHLHSGTQRRDVPRPELMNRDEPTIAEVQAWAIHFAEVHPDKIRHWRRQARIRAWLPDVDIGVDGGRGWSRSDSLWGSSSSGGSHHTGPDDKSSSRDIGWDVSLSWDLADIIWSTDQTTIDTRAKLTVELREDIVNQVTRIYFERRRLQLELSQPSLDGALRLDHELRIAELTALLDGMTGQAFSNGIHKPTD